MEIKKIPISEVDVWEKNPRNIKTKDFERLKRQIQELGVYKPLICFQENGKYITLGGNMRLRALRELGRPDIDISIVKADTEAMKIKYSLSDNDRVGQYMEQELAELVYPHLEEINLEDFKLDIGEPISLKNVIEDYGPDINGEDEIPEIDDSPAITKMGDLFQLGRHRLLCGDATKEEDVKKLMNGEKADMVFTDPPYGIDLDADYSKLNRQKAGTKKADDYGQMRNVNTFENLIGDIEEFDPSLIFKHFESAREMFLWGANYYCWNLPRGGSWTVWDKRCQESLDATFGSGFELCWSKMKHKQDIARIVWTRFLGHIQSEDGDRKYHPTQKPVKLAIWFFKRWGKDINLIVDPYIGSGTTLIACEKLNQTIEMPIFKAFICYGMEIEPKYCDVIITRFSNFKGTPEEEIRATRENV